MESDLADRLSVGRVSQVRFDAFLEPLREYLLGARVHEADLTGEVHDYDRLGEIFHQRSEVGGGFRRRLRRLVASAFFGVHIGSANEGHGMTRPLFFEPRSFHVTYSLLMNWPPFGPFIFSTSRAVVRAANVLLMNWPLFGQFIFRHQPRSRSPG